MGLTQALRAENSGTRRRSNAAAGALVGTRCRACATPSWPGRAVCHQCGSADLAEETFSPSGVLITHTTVHVARPGIPAPYMLGQVQLDDNGPMIFGQILGLPADAAVPTPLTTVLGNPGQLPWYWFSPVTTD